MKTLTAAVVTGLSCKRGANESLLAVPAYLLYELGIIAARWLVPGIREVEAQQANQSSD